MARYNDEARVLADLFKDKNRLKAQIAGATDKIQIGKRSTGNVKIEQWNAQTRTRSVSGNGFMLDNADFGVLDTNILDSMVFGSYSVVDKQRWEWNDQTALEEGTADGNIDLTNGDIRMK